MFFRALPMCLPVLLWQAASSVPDLKTLLKDVRAHQDRLDQIREDYTFHRVTRTDELASNGSVSSEKSEESDCFYVNGRLIGRVMKRNGAELSGREDREEQERVRKQVEKFGKTPGSRGHTAANLISAILPVAKVWNPRRVSVNNRETLAFDFAGDPKAQAHGLVQEAAKKMSGEIWIDEAERQVARIRIRIDENFRVAGGLLASFRKGTTLNIEQTPVGEGLWLPSKVEQHLDARVALVKGYREDVHIRDSDFRKFDVSSVQRIETRSQSQEQNPHPR